jgi:hypothetical protein
MNEIKKRPYVLDEIKHGRKLLLYMIPVGIVFLIIIYLTDSDWVMGVLLLTYCGILGYQINKVFFGSSWTRPEEKEDQKSDEKSGA